MPRSPALPRHPDAEAVASLRLDLGEAGTVSALLQAPAEAKSCLVLAHGAGAGMTHAFLADSAHGLFRRGIATLRYQFPYMERQSRRPDVPRVAHAAVRAAVAEAARRLPGLPLFAGGKSFGGRMTSQAHAALPLPDVHGLVFFGFPLHPAGKPAIERAHHLHALKSPMLFLQGTKDALADESLMRTLIEALGPRATVEWIEQADHSFHVPARSGRSDAEVLQHLLDVIARWIDRTVAA